SDRTLGTAEVEAVRVEVDEDLASLVRFFQEGRLAATTAAAALVIPLNAGFAAVTELPGRGMSGERLVRRAVGLHHVGCPNLDVRGNARVANGAKITADRHAGRAVFPTGGGKGEM